MLFANDLMNNNLLHLIPQVKQSDLCYSPGHIITFISMIGISLVGAASAFASFRIIENLRLELTQIDHSSPGSEIGTIHNQSVLRLHTLAFPRSRKRNLYIALRRATIVISVVFIVSVGANLYYFRNMPPTFSPCR